MMRGVRINNYIDNRIMLSGRKIKNQVQAVIQSHRPKPLIVNHLNQIQHEEEIVTEERSPKVQVELTSNKKRKKRTKTIAMNNVHQAFPSSNKNRVSLSLEQLKKGLTSAKKKSIQSSPSKDSDPNHLAETQRKLKPIYKETGNGLGKRSKSAIIKNTKAKEKSNEKMVKVEEEKGKRMKEKSKKHEARQKKKSVQVKKQKQKKVNCSSDFKKVPSSMNLSSKSKKNTKSTERKRSIKIKSSATSAHQSKPISARQNGGIIRKKLFSNKRQVPLQILHFKKEIIQNTSSQECNVKKIMSQLEEALNTVGSRKKFAKQLEIMTQKIKELAREQGNESEEDSENNLKNITEEKERLLENIRDSENSKTEKLYDENDENGQYLGDDILMNFQIMKEISKISQRKSEELAESNRQATGEINIDDHIILTNESRITSEKDQSNDQREEMEKRENEDKQEKEEKEEKEESNSQNEDQSDQLRNPIIGRRGNNEVQLEIEYDSIKSHDERQNEIALLKKFKEESSKMMEKVERINPKPLQINVSPQKEVVVELKEKTPTNIEAYAFEKYPKIEDLKSPKVNQQEIVNIISLKEKVDDDKHNKLSELVHVMYDRKLVSPKTYENQLTILKQKKEQEVEMLESYKKHAEELSRLLLDIKKEKEEIYDIDELIRSEKWNEAIKLVEKNKTSERKYSFPKEVEKIKNNFEESSEEIQPIYYSGDREEENSTILLHPVPVDENDSHFMPSEIQNQSIIKIDENQGNQEKPQRKGFQSNLYFIKQYCIALCEFVRDRYGDSFKESIGRPLQFNMFELLKSYRTLKSGSTAHHINSIYEEISYHEQFRSLPHPPIHKQIFDKFNQNYENLKYFGKEESRDAELQGIFLTSIYNALNESLNNERPGGLNGKPLPWAHSSKHLKNNKNKVENKGRRRQEHGNADAEDLIFGIAIARIIQWGSCLCGFIPDTAELENTEIDEEYVNHIRETRMALLLEKMLTEEENDMAENELEVTEVKLSLTKCIIEEILEEEINEMKKIAKRRILRQIDY